MEEFTKRCVEAIMAIPEGKVMTYGGIARFCDHPRAARQVARILYSMSKKYELPWHRVINSKGEISLKGEGLERQIELLKKENIQVSATGKVDLKKYQYDPYEFTLF